jgi:sterol desaturase/sphingolipid hydroxylase (fatty acid hydroxylase superfamily)
MHLSRQILVAGSGEGNYGVSVPFWDYVFGTAIRRRRGMAWIAAAREEY